MHHSVNVSDLLKYQPTSWIYVLLWSHNIGVKKSQFAINPPCLRTNIVTILVSCMYWHVLTCTSLDLVRFCEILDEVYQMKCAKLVIISSNGIKRTVLCKNKTVLFIILGIWPLVFSASCANCKTFWPPTMINQIVWPYYDNYTK